MQNLQCQSVETSVETPKICDTPLLTAVAAVAEIPQEPALDEENVWEEWPYCWAITAWDLAQERFHSFHTNLSEWRLSRANRHDREQFQADFWQAWNSAENEEREMRLV